jgi:hypothetical protein
MVKMGRFLARALERALARNMKAEVVVRFGMLREELPMVVYEMEATAAVLESPAGETRVIEAAELERLPGILDQEMNKGRRE